MGARTEITLEQPPAEVWPHLSQPDRILRWCRSLVRLSRPLDAPAGTPLALLCRRPDGRIDACTGQALEADPPHLLRWQTASDRFHATNAYRLKPCGGGTRLEHELEVQARYALAQPLAGAAQSVLSMHHAADLRRLQAQLGARPGEPEEARRGRPASRALRAGGQMARGPRPDSLPHLFAAGGEGAQLAGLRGTGR